MSVPAFLPCERIELCRVRLDGRYWRVIGVEIMPDGVRQPFESFWRTSSDAMREASAMDRQNAERLRLRHARAL